MSSDAPNLSGVGPVSVFRLENGPAKRRVRLINDLLGTPIKDDVFTRRQRLSFFDPRISALQILRAFQPSEIHFVYFPYNVEGGFHGCASWGPSCTQPEE